ncbi:MAG: class I SAM-dependent DNA methyltransferase [Candidatus Dormibacteraeota bacterium]|uniref:site-specific DNA-methyltransferase (adenine-specific) n=1 Tax=Candidatus Nephthysia bennettiae TaxID=3127016 RepID=A0A934K6V3_9BACT|nr:class I SAM-dependent DNA methyltransferase [Candidatus Dormibacteraeota bacterium]
MTPAEFALKWKGSTRTERAASQEHFIDLCRMLDVLTPNEADPAGDFYAFEKGAEKTAGGDGFADVWKRGHFAWEYKGKRKDLAAAYQQLLQYREALENPPLLVVCDLDRFEIHTNFTNTTKRVHAFDLDGLLTTPAEPLRLLRAVMTEPFKLQPRQTREELTERAAGEFAALAQALRTRGHDPQRVAHFLNKLLFCMFAEDARLLPAALLRRIIEGSREHPEALAGALSELFGTMSAKGGRFGADPIDWFNGGLFDGPDVLPLEPPDVDVIRKVSLLDWSQVEPAIFGTLFERGLDPGKRSQFGAHYTDRASIERVIEPVVLAPLRAEFEAMQRDILSMSDRDRTVVRGRGRDRGAIDTRSRAYRRYHQFLDRLRAIRVLDPACGSGNFLYMALQALKDLEKEVILWAAEALHIPLEFPQVSPTALRGIELNPYAAELARVSIWIGEIQWMLANGFAYLRNPILRPLDNVECRDAVLDNGSRNPPVEPAWPTADFIIGNPPFVGGKLMRAYLGDEYVAALFVLYNGRVPHEVDYVCYWHEKARAMIAAGQVRRAGLLATQGIRGGANRRVLDRIKSTGDIFMAWEDEPWVVEGAMVHVSIIGFDDGSETERTLNGKPVVSINSDLTSGLDLTKARTLRENLGIAFQGPVKVGPFEIAGSLARSMLESPNPHGKSNHDVLRPWVNGRDLTQRPRGLWIIDFGDMPMDEAALYEAPFEYVRRTVAPKRAANRRPRRRDNWWQHGETVPGLRAATAALTRVLATPRLTKHRLFVWLEPDVLPDSQVIAFARDDDFFLGVLQSRVHELWARRTGTQLREEESGFRYTPRTTFETFPLPQCAETEREPVATAAKALDTFRQGWLNPAGALPTELKNRTLTNLYNQRPAWLLQAHERLDRAVHAAYGWSYPLDDQVVLSRLLELNLGRPTYTARA